MTFSMVLVASFAYATQAQSEDEAPASTGILPIPDYSGGLLDRSFLLGDFDGSRTALAENGLQFQIDWTQTLQSVVDGGLQTDTRYGGTLDYTLLLDFDRMGVMPGGMLKVRGESRYGESVNALTGQVIAADTDGFVPLGDELDDNIALTLTTVFYTQFLSETFGVMLGKLDNLDSDFNEFASGRGTSQFLNSNFVFSPVTLNEPISTLGAGLLWIPNEHVTAWTFLYNLTDASTTTGFGDIGDGWTWTAEVYLQYLLGDRPGGMAFGGAYNFDADFTEIGSARFVRGPDGPMLSTRSAQEGWSAYWNMWQYLWTPEPAGGPLNIEDGRADHRGVGMFLRAGVADQNVNPIEWTFSGGVGGRGLIPSREDDTFGTGFFYTSLHESRLFGILGIDDHSQGFEAYYDIAITPATNLTLDCQVLDSPLPDVDTAIVLGFRFGTRF